LFIMMSPWLADVSNDVMRIAKLWCFRGIIFIAYCKI
jgi:hypothetical protein